MFEGFIYQNRVFKCNPIIEFKDFTILKRATM